jgi:hypothetical protein
MTNTIADQANDSIFAAQTQFKADLAEKIDALIRKSLKGSYLLQGALDPERTKGAIAHEIADSVFAILSAYEDHS